MITNEKIKWLSNTQRLKLKDYQITVDPINKVDFNTGNVVYLGETVTLRNVLTNDFYFGIGKTSHEALKDAYEKIDFKKYEIPKGNGRNKFYVVKDNYNDDGIVNIVIAKNVREAKKRGSYIEATESAEFWTDISCEAIKEGHSFFLDGEDRQAQFWVTGKGFVYTDLEGQLDSFFTLLLNELRKQNRLDFDLVPNESLKKFNWDDFETEDSEKIVLPTVKATMKKISEEFPMFTIFYDETEYSGFSCLGYEVFKVAEKKQKNLDIALNYCTVNKEKQVIYICSDLLETK